MKVTIRAFCALATSILSQEIQATPALEQLFEDALQGARIYHFVTGADIEEAKGTKDEDKVTERIGLTIEAFVKLAEIMTGPTDASPPKPSSTSSTSSPAIRNAAAHDAPQAKSDAIYSLSGFSNNSRSHHFERRRFIDGWNTPIGCISYVV